MRSWVLAAGWVALASTAWGYDGIVDKQVFEFGPYTTVNGEAIAEVRVG